MKRLALLLALASMAFAAPASAGWHGCWVGANVGMSATDTETSLDFAATNIATVDGFAASGAQAGLGVGCDVQIERFVLGAFADYQWLDGDFSISSGLLPGQDLAALGSKRTKNHR